MKRAWAWALAAGIAAGAGCSREAEDPAVPPKNGASVPADLPTEDDTEMIRAAVLALIDAKRTNAANLDALIDAWQLPDPAGWFQATFEEATAKELTEWHPKWMARFREGLIGRLEQLATLESPIAEIRRYVTGDEPGVLPSMRKGLTTMKRRQPMYMVNFDQSIPASRGVDWVVVVIDGKPHCFFVHTPRHRR